MEQGAIMMVQQRRRHMEETSHMGVEVRLMEEEVATQVVLQVMKLEIIQLVDTANLFLMQGQDMAHLLALPTVDILSQTRTSPTVNQVVYFMLFHNSERHRLAVIVFLYCKLCSSSWFEVTIMGDKFAFMNTNTAEFLLCVCD